MAQTTLITAATAAGTSATDRTIVAGSVETFALYTSASAGIPGNESVTLFLGTPGNDLVLAELTGVKPFVQVSGPAVVRATKGVTSIALGLFVEA